MRYNVGHEAFSMSLDERKDASRLDDSGDRLKGNTATCVHAIA